MENFNWHSLSPFFSAEYTRNFLKQKYKQRNIEEPEKRAFENCYPFMYYVEHGKIYFIEAKKVSLILRPILLYYGLVHFIKACILTVDPNYPETTSVLAHGVSTRKRKKQQYLFVQDEVKFQKSGLFPFMACKLFNLTTIEGEKVTMGELFEQIPELNPLFYELKGKQTFHSVTLQDRELWVSTEVLNFFHMTEERFVQYYISKSKCPLSLKEWNHQYIKFTLENTKHSSYFPLKYNITTNRFELPLKKELGFLYEELMVHFLLLYNLSMVARYETEWWGELIKTMPNEDYPFIETFLSISLLKGPQLIYEQLVKK